MLDFPARDAFHFGELQCVAKTMFSISSIVASIITSKLQP